MNCFAALTTVLFAYVSASTFASPASEKACHEYGKELKAATLLDAAGEKFKDQKSAAEVLKKLNVTAEAAPGSKSVMPEIVAKLPNITEKDLAKAFYGVSTACPPVLAEYQALKALLPSVRSFKMGSESETQATLIAKNYIKRTTKNPGTLIDQLTSVALLEQLANGGFLKLDRKQLESVFALSKQAQLVKEQIIASRSETDPSPASASEFKKLPEAQRKKMVEDFKFELTKTEQLRKSLVEIANVI